MSRQILGAGFLALAFALSSITAPASAQTVPPNFMNQPVVTGINQPTSLAFLPDGRVLFTEQRSGQVRMIVNGHIAATDPVVTVSQLNAISNERGLLAITVDPDWPTRPFVYVYYDRTGNRNRLARYDASGDLNNPNGENLTLSNQLLILDNIPDLAGNHNGGALRFGPDEHLYLSLGDDASNCSAQDSTSQRGQLLRLDVSTLPPGPGGPVPYAAITPPDNPLVTSDSSAALVYAYGLRNPFRFHIDPVTGLLYVADVGEVTFEEMSEVGPGDNLGWPFREGFQPRSPGGCSEPGGFNTGNYKPPIVAYGRAMGRTIISGGIYRPPAGGTELWPMEYWGDVFYADYYTRFLRRLNKSGGTWAPEPYPGQVGDNWATGLVTPADFLVGPDGSVWWVSQFDLSFGTFTGSINRIRYTGPPVGVPAPEAASARLTATPTPFAAATELGFSLTVPAIVRLAIYDVSGREVRRLLDGPAESGRTLATWDGTDGAGRRM
ncbi:MAG TPA: PQQ-dependent sugar dehydrogenase, partial [Candidatus Limnocylindria bacterium]|nr:PQQ-dependent sugar dehydrogenase [Candidatus Limnocylindria bacterium]